VLNILHTSSIFVLLRIIVVVITVFVVLFLYCTFKIYLAIRISSHKCVIKSVISVQCEPYQGGGKQIDSDLGLEGSVVDNLLSKLPKQDYFVYIDNYFMSLRLLQKLKGDGMLSTATSVQLFMACGFAGLVTYHQQSTSHIYEQYGQLVYSNNIQYCYCALWT